MFNRENLISFFNRLTALAEKLPQQVSHPILKELTPIREIFLAQRPARLMLLGESTATVSELLETWCKIYPTARHSEKGWHNYSLPDRGILQILDARQALPEDHLQTIYPPDVAVIFAGSTLTHSDILWLKACSPPEGPKCPVLFLNINESQDYSLPAELGGHEVRTVSSSSTAAALLCELLPNSAKLEMARVLKAKDAQHQIANTLLHSFAAVCGIVGMQPIPLADLPILTSLQSFMVAIIAYCSGRSFNVKTTAEFLGAVGINIGAGMACREGARAVVRLVPFWGNTVSGFVAAGGTYAIGKAAIAYFIDEIPTTSRMINKWRKKRPLIGDSQRETNGAD